MRYLLDTDIAISWLRGVERARQIAASALRPNVTLLTNNRRDFERIEGLTIESV